MIDLRSCQVRIVILVEQNKGIEARLRALLEAKNQNEQELLNAAKDKQLTIEEFQEAINSDKSFIEDQVKLVLRG